MNQLIKSGPQNAENGPPRKKSKVSMHKLSESAY